MRTDFFSSTIAICGRYIRLPISLPLKIIPLFTESQHVLRNEYDERTSRVDKTLRTNGPINRRASSISFVKYRESRCSPLYQCFAACTSSSARSSRLRNEH